MAKKTEIHTPVVDRPTSSMATVSLIAGVLGLTLFPFLGSIVAVVTGVIARREIRDSGGALGGDGLATAGLVLGGIGVGLTVFGLCIAGVVIGLPLCMGLFFAGTGEFSWLVPMILAVV